MTGLLLITTLLLAITFTIITTINNIWGQETPSGYISVISSILFIVLLAIIPITRLDSKTNVQEAIVLQQTLNYNREELKGTFNSIERHPLMEHVIVANQYISKWKVKGEKWYMNKWYYHPSTQNINYIK